LASGDPAGVTPLPRLLKSDKLAVAYVGRLDNAPCILEYLLKLGYKFESKTDEDLIYMLLNRYLEVGISPAEAMKLVLLRLRGRFAMMLLISQPEEMLMVGSRGCPLALGVCNESLIAGSDIEMLKPISQSVMRLEEGNPIVLCSV